MLFAASAHDRYWHSTAQANAAGMSAAGEADIRPLDGISRFAE